MAWLYFYILSYRNLIDRHDCHVVCQWEQVKQRRFSLKIESQKHFCWIYFYFHYMRSHFLRHNRLYQILCLVSWLMILKLIKCSLVSNQMLFMSLHLIIFRNFFLKTFLVETYAKDQTHKFSFARPTTVVLVNETIQSDDSILAFAFSFNNHFTSCQIMQIFSLFNFSMEDGDSREPVWCPRFTRHK